MGDVIETLPVLQRMALAYVPRRAHSATLALLALDWRLSDIVHRASEPMLAQIRLAWWREQLAKGCEQGPHGEPLIALLSSWGENAKELSTLVDGWEHLVGPSALNAQDVEAFARGRGESFAALARRLGTDEAAENAMRMGGDWAVADLAATQHFPDDEQLLEQVLAARSWKNQSLPRDLRPLAVLHGLAVRTAGKGQSLGDLSPVHFLSAVRIGLLGV